MLRLPATRLLHLGKVFESGQVEDRLVQDQVETAVNGGQIAHLYSSSATAPSVILLHYVNKKQRLPDIFLDFIFFDLRVYTPAVMTNLCGSIG